MNQPKHTHCPACKLSHEWDCKLHIAAPDLLAALTEIYDHAEHYGAAPFSADKMFARARAAIRRAT